MLGHIPSHKPGPVIYTRKIKNTSHLRYESELVSNQSSPSSGESSTLAFKRSTLMAYLLNDSSELGNTDGYLAVVCIFSMCGSFDGSLTINQRATFLK